MIWPCGWLVTLLMLWLSGLPWVLLEGISFFQRGGGFSLCYILDLKMVVNLGSMSGTLSLPSTGRALGWQGRGVDAAWLW